MSLYIQKGTPSDGPDEFMHCSFLAFDLGICTADADGLADQPCCYCVRQHPHILKENIKRRRRGKRGLQHRVHDSKLDAQFEKLKEDASRPPAGQSLCYLRHLKQGDYDVNNAWFKELLKARRLHNLEKKKNRLRFSHIIVCESVPTPLALCPECVEVMHRYSKAKEYIEEDGSQQQKKLFTKDGRVTHECMMQKIPTEKDLAGLWKERFKRSGPEGCQRVLGEHQICGNDYEVYRKRLGGKEVIDHYFGEDRVRRSVPAEP